MLKIYNSLSQKKEEFKPIKPGFVSMYVCGMTVYDYCHLGHARVLIAFDVIARYLRYRGFNVNYVRNITDIDDKILNRAQENNESVDKLTGRFIEAMHEDERALDVLPPDIEPKATDHIGEIITMIERLIANGYAYPADNGDVYYEIDKFSEYGKLSKRKVEDLIAGARVEVDEFKQNPLDFVLWKSAKPGETSWQSPWGKGRPGWHIECSAMSTKCLGDSFDIHGGGPDLKFPHHENEIAQSEAATGKHYVNYWMHAGAVRVNKEKMSKSLGNFFTIREILAEYPAEVVRYLIVASHYRSAIDYSEDALKEAQASLERFYLSVREFSNMEDVQADEKAGVEYQKRFNAAMDDDFNTSLAISVLFDMVKQLNIAKRDNEQSAVGLAMLLIKMAQPLGILQGDPELFLQGSGEGLDSLPVEEIESWIEKRNEARAQKDWVESDRIRDLLKDQGVELNDSREGTTWRRI